MKKEAISNAQAAKWHEIMETGDVMLAEHPRPFTESTQESPQIEQAAPIIESHSKTLADNASNIDQLREAVMSFDGCKLKLTAKNTVFSDGQFGAPIMMIGEAPGASEDEQGIPFCGESGKLLDNIVSSIGLNREKNIYISNSIFWRPPANRRPTDEEIEICKPFIEKHIALAKPKLLILVGATAVSALLGKHLQISKIRQEYYQYKNPYLDDTITTTAIFHPAYLLRQPYQKRSMWYDLLKIQQFIEKF
jgi:uracil-DNA glycosylase